MSERLIKGMPFSEYRKVWYKENKAKHKEYVAKWKANDPEKAKMLGRAASKRFLDKLKAEGKYEEYKQAHRYTKKHISKLCFARDAMTGHGQCENLTLIQNIPYCRIHGIHLGDEAMAKFSCKKRHRAAKVLNTASPVNPEPSTFAKKKPS